MQIAETSSGVYFYHLIEGSSHVQGKLTGICGEKFQGWSTLMSVQTWGYVGHLHEKYCSGCTEVKEKHDAAR